MKKNFQSQLQIEKSRLPQQKGFQTNRFDYNTVVLNRVSLGEQDSYKRSISVVQTSMHSQRDDEQQEEQNLRIQTDDIVYQSSPKSLISSLKFKESKQKQILEQLPFQLSQEQEIVMTEHSNDQKAREIQLNEDVENLKMDKIIKDKKELQEEDLNSILLNLIKRKRFSYTGRNILEYIVNCLCLKKIKTLKHQKAYKNQFIFKKGQDKFLDELDVISILKSMRQVKLLTQVLLNQRQNMILKFQRKNLIETSSSSEDSDNNNRFYTSKLMESKNPMIRLIIFGKLKKMVQSYKSQKLEDLDKRLLRGLFIRKLKDFDEDEQEKLKNKTLLMRVRDVLIRKLMSNVDEESRERFITNEVSNLKSFENNYLISNERSINESLNIIDKSSLENDNLKENRTINDQLDLQMQFDQIFSKESKERHAKQQAMDLV
ncbi:UNKNOWN [Stylonychia lemnae]|uniref:Uncharacterized protein n=1 Tax=Stylonychia lemnae TaxID=5949 RepID=A0A077ZPS1_STYLE|nr:UNKNOWN [Stylonychia lemnae]|eukprot:CDW71370.1 UNKNOWN [Stylonychia lemnae]